MQTNKNLFLINKAKEYFLKCTEGVKHAAMSDRDITLQNEMKLEMDQIFRYLENEIKIYSRKAQGIKLMIDVKPLHDINVESISMKWKKLFYKIEDSFERIQWILWCMVRFWIVTDASDFTMQGS